jgi:hypothetical protein
VFPSTSSAPLISHTNEMAQWCYTCSKIFNFILERNDMCAAGEARGRNDSTAALTKRIKRGYSVS